MSSRRRLGALVCLGSLFAASLSACGSSERPRPWSADDTGGAGAAPPVEPTSGVATVATDPTSAPPGDDGSQPGWGIVEKQPTYGEVVNRVVGMVSQQGLQSSVQRRGLNLLNLMWEDTGRFQGSSVGPNISDLTLQVRYTEAGQNRAALLPVIRFPNFTDRTGDIPADRFLVRIGNQKKNGALETVPLTDVLKDVKRFMTDGNSVLGSGNLLAARDTHFLASAQAVFLPIPKQGHAEFTPVLFNYQSFKGSPAVATILVTRQGTSITVIENEGNERSPVATWGQELYFNKGGERAPFTAERKSDVKARIDAQGGPKTEDDRSALARGADVLFIVQVPLKQKARPLPPPMPMSAPSGAGGGAMKPSMAPSAASPAAEGAAMRSDVEQAVLGHGKAEGKFFEGRGLRLERDERFPIRVTVQFYKATSNGVADESDLDAIAKTIGGVYEHADFVGSLVVPEGDPRRPTAWQSVRSDWFPW